MDSLKTAFTNLLERHGLPTDNIELGEDPDWQTISLIDPRVQVAEIGQAGTWPHTTDAIVMFFVQSETEPYVVDNGFQKANLQATYCLMHDPAKKLVQDSDGSLREAGNYGVPVGWASYAFDLDKLPSKPEKLHKKLKGESIWSIARRFKIPAKDLIEHNDIEDPNQVPDGTILHLPVPKEAKPERTIVYEVLPQPKQMHVSKEGGTQKWSFGNVRDWADFTTSGFYPKNTNVTIMAIAHVPVGDEDTAAYYMDTTAFGDYAETNRVAYTLGFAWSDLTEGSFIPAKAPPPTKEPLAVPEVKEVQATKIIKKQVEGNKEIMPEKYPNSFKTTRQVLDQPALVTANLPPGQDYLTIHDYAGHRPDKNMPKEWEGYIAETFEVDGVLYGRPLGSVKNVKQDPHWRPNWYGIPMDCLISNDELYNGDIVRRLPALERYLWVPLFQKSSKVRKYVKQKNNKRTN